MGRHTTVMYQESSRNNVIFALKKQTHQVDIF